MVVRARLLFAFCIFLLFCICDKKCGIGGILQLGLSLASLFFFCTISVIANCCFLNYKALYMLRKYSLTCSIIKPP